MWEKVKGVSESITDSVKEKIPDLASSTFVADFSKKAAKMIEDIDAHLTQTNSSYEISSFRVAANASIVGGVNLDITFTKSTVAKTISNERRNELEVTNSKTGKTFRISRTACAGKDFVKVKDPNTGEVLTVDTRTGQATQSD
jgi:hypothetical protein